MSAHKFLSEWFLTSPDNIQRQQIISGSTAQTADRRQQQATTWKTLPIILQICKLICQEPQLSGHESVSYTSEGKDKGRSTDISLCFGTKQLNHSQSGSLIQPPMNHQPHWLDINGKHYPHCWSFLPLCGVSITTDHKCSSWVELSGTHAVNNYKAVDQSNN